MELKKSGINDSDGEQNQNTASKSDSNDPDRPRVLTFQTGQCHKFLAQQCRQAAIQILGGKDFIAEEDAENREKRAKEKEGAGKLNLDRPGLLETYNEDRARRLAKEAEQA